MRAYDRILNFIGRRRNAYCAVFLTQDERVAPRAQEVLEDLARFCRANESCFHKDPRAHAALEGRREVWLRIQQNLQLSDEQLAQIYSPVQPRMTTKETSND